ncbi:hypothetical protein ACFVIM_28660 [Streptomyces sp. NPDC057638]|uniref:hypothetical protein n=1 Tax=Streptomyces sp. NPDC057638 TaxID=3346190 RepID=UPI00368BD368
MSASTARDQALAARDTVITRYRDDGETLKALAAEYRVSDAWLKKQLTRWGVPVRGVREARIHRAQQRKPQ